MILTISGILLMLFGTAISIIFWIPAIFDRNKIREITGKRYPLVYIVYIANGPMLILVGLLLIIWPKFS
jgi:hypothetical protein